MKKIFLLIFTLPLFSFAEGDPNLVFQAGGASSTALGTTAKAACPMCVKNKLRLNNKNTNAYQNGQGNIDPVTGEVQTGK